MIFLVDTRSPSINSCPSDIVMCVKSGTQYVTIEWVPPSATDDTSASITVEQSHSPGGIFQVGETNVTYKFTDASNNSAFCVFGVNVVEDTGMISSTQYSK